MRYTVRDFETAARAELDPVYADFIAGGARDEITVRANEVRSRTAEEAPEGKEEVAAAPS
ncbi:hypothetical protein [Streptomyces sp. NPDC101455]|uniref:hypothetical protein n=1 Tax=Streptomyces sp. NPDC101455 TaxID=3366142 RepID=UPI00380FF785